MQTPYSPANAILVYFRSHDRRPAFQLDVPCILPSPAKVDVHMVNFRYKTTDLQPDNGTGFDKSLYFELIDCFHREDGRSYQNRRADKSKVRVRERKRRREWYNVTTRAESRDKRSVQC